MDRIAICSLRLGLAGMHQKRVNIYYSGSTLVDKPCSEWRLSYNGNDQLEIAIILYKGKE